MRHQTCIYLWQITARKFRKSNFFCSIIRVELGRFGQSSWRPGQRFYGGGNQMILPKRPDNSAYNRNSD
jgi:hypothetical protein